MVNNTTRVACPQYNMTPTPPPILQDAKNIIEEVIALVRKKLTRRRNVKKLPPLPPDIVAQVKNDLKGPYGVYNHPAGGFSTISPWVLCHEMFRNTHLTAEELETALVDAFAPNQKQRRKETPGGNR